MSARRSSSRFRVAVDILGYFGFFPGQRVLKQKNLPGWIQENPERPGGTRQPRGVYKQQQKGFSGKKRAQ
jgi:hypothetical protein